MSPGIFPAHPLYGPWPPLYGPLIPGGEFDPAGPLSALVLLPLAGALVTILLPGRAGRAATRFAFLWALPGALFLLAATWFGAGADAHWYEFLPGGGALQLSAWNLVGALAVALAAPLALALPEPRAADPVRAAGLLVFAAATHIALLAATPGLAAVGWLGGAWALFGMLGHADAAGEGEAAVGPFVAHAIAALAVFIAGLAPPFAGALVIAGAIRLGLPPFHGTLARSFELLPTGAVLLCGVGFVTTGLVALASGLATVAAGGRELGGTAALGFAGVALWGGLVGLPQDDVRRRLAGYVSTQGAVWAAILAADDSGEGRALVARWAVVFLLGFTVLVAGSARLWAFTRTGDLRAYGGLGRTAVVRSGLLIVTMLALTVAPLLAFGLRALATFGQLFAVAPLVGLGVVAGGALATLGFGLAVYRTVRGAPPGPVPAPDLSGREWLFVFGLFALLLFLGALGTPAGGAGALWPSFAGGGA
jgi:NADH:ubiquinone oxidoreductase subunit 4 (subunit M)